MYGVVKPYTAVMVIVHGAFSEKFMGVALGPELEPRPGTFLQVQKISL